MVGKTRLFQRTGSPLIQGLTRKPPRNWWPLALALIVVAIAIAVWVYLSYLR